MKLPAKNYYRPDELADEWGCTPEDIFQWHRQGDIRLGVLVSDTGLIGLNANGQVLGYYRVSGILSIPPDCAVKWSIGGTDPAEVQAIHIGPNDHPSIQGKPREDFDSMEPSARPPNWAPGCTWIEPATDHGLIHEFRIGVYYGDAFKLERVAIKKEYVVVPAAERERIAASSDPRTADRQDRPGNALDRLLARTYLALRDGGMRKPPAAMVWRALKEHDTDRIIRQQEGSKQGDKDDRRLVWVDPDTRDTASMGYHRFETRLGPISKMLG